MKRTHSRRAKRLIDIRDEAFRRRLEYWVAFADAVSDAMKQLTIGIEELARRSREAERRSRKNRARR